ncbi:MAG TPA: pyridoxamine 5'-phosphate oxidase family protein [Dehalococcoidia bacterium]|nr:pyridoxamine 5'-phosphate oxidase family protein [Dehalococcoidia bacterium]
MNEVQRTFAAEPHVAIFSSVDAKSRPHSTPIWYRFDGETFTFSVSRGGQKHKNVERTPEVSVVIDSRVVPYYALMISGRAEIGPPLDDAERSEMAVRYLGPDLGKRYVEATAGNISVSIRLKPRKVIEFSGRAGRSVR